MTVELKSGYGVRLSDAPDLTFGMSRDQVLSAWRGRRVYWVCGGGVGWARGINLTGVDIAASVGREDRLRSVHVSRLTTFATLGVEGLSAHEPVIYHDVDLFYWPAADVADYLTGTDLADRTYLRVSDSLMLWRSTGEACFTEVSFGTLGRD